VPLEPLAPWNQRLIIGLDLDPAELWSCGPRNRSPVRCGQQLPAETDPENRYVIMVGVPEHREFRLHPGSDRVMIIYRPRCTHGNDHVEVLRFRKLRLDIGRSKAAFGHHLMYPQVITAIDKPLADEAGSANVVMLDHQSAHSPESNLDPNDRSSGLPTLTCLLRYPAAIVRIRTNVGCGDRRARL
jgi:hypothetical protein